MPDATPPVSLVLLRTSKVGRRKLASAAARIRSPTSVESEPPGAKTSSATPATVPSRRPAVIRKKPPKSMECHSLALINTVMGRANSKGVTGTDQGRIRTSAGTATRAYPKPIEPCMTAPIATAREMIAIIAMSDAPPRSERHRPGAHVLWKTDLPRIPALSEVAQLAGLEPLQYQLEGP